MQKSSNNRLKHAVEAINRAEQVADQLANLESDAPGAAQRLAAYGRAFIERAYAHVQRLPCYCTGSRLDVALRHRLTEVRGRL